jgi:hypothetical protein
MRINTAMMIVLVMVLMFGSQALAQGQLQIEDVQSEIVGSPDSAGNVQFSVTATALNPSVFGTVFSVEVQGLDGAGSPLTSVYVQGRVEGGSRGHLVGQGSMPLDKYSSIVNWVQAR